MQTMKISLFGGGDVTTVREVVERVRAGAADGFDTIWFPQRDGLDTLTALAAAGREVPEVGLGTAVVPIQGRHPIPLAQQALTVADAAGPGRFTLGVGVTHPMMSEGRFGIPYAGIVDLCAEELHALAPLLSSGRSAAVVGPHLTARIQLTVSVPAPSLVVAALGPRMLELAGSLTDGTVTWMTGPRALAQQIVLRIRAAAARAGRSEPRIIVGLPICLTRDVEDARARLRRSLSIATQLPTYRRMIAAEGLSDPAELALVGDEDTLCAQLDNVAAAGATELLADITGTADEQTRTRNYLAKWRYFAPCGAATTP
jgi:F420-dependent oxidoreductase-like protein